MSKGKKKGRKHRDPRPFENALLTVKRHERPSDYPGLTAATRRSASAAQFRIFATMYSYDWRHTKIRLYRHLLETRPLLVERERERLTLAEKNPEYTVYQEMTNGLIASAASEFCQYAEDLAVLARACSSEDFFARDLTSASAGRMQDEVKSWENITTEQAARILHIPWFPPNGSWEGTEIGRSYLRALDLAAERLRHIGSLYTTWQFHFMRYKHGLLLALRVGQPQGPQEIVEYVEGKKGNLAASPVAFDAGSIGEALRDAPQQGLVLPDIGTESIDVRCNAARLASERNLLRLVFPPGDDTSIELFERAASYISQAQLVLIENRGAEIRPDPERSYFMPADDAAAHFRVARIDKRTERT